MTPHITSNRLTPSTGHDGMADNKGWSSVQLWRDGEPVPDLVRRCPKTYEALKLVPQPHFSKRNPSAPAVIFSVLGAGARIPPHTGSTNVRLICHLPLVVPPNCHLRVGNEIRDWERGKLLIFDDTIEHEARNDSDQDRAVLIFDIWRPDLSEEERSAVTAMFRCREALAIHASP